MALRARNRTGRSRGIDTQYWPALSSQLLRRRNGVFDAKALLICLLQESAALEKNPSGDIYSLIATIRLAEEAITKMRPATNGSQAINGESGRTTQSSPDTPISVATEDEERARYEIRLTLAGLGSDREEDLKQLVEAFVETRITQACVDSLTVNIKQAPVGSIDERIVTLDELYYALPPELRRPEIRVSLSEHYHRELSWMWGTVRDTGCVEGVVELRTWRRAGTQFICEFLSFDRAVPRGHQYNLHGQETSQWSNPETGWYGHQGAIVLDTQSGAVSAHH